jgi:type II secretory pathway component GspD/PulD (secretin)
VDLGQSLDVTPFLSASGACAVTIDASCKEFLGWADVGEQQIPRFRIRSANRNANIPAGQSLLLGLTQKSGGESSQDKRMLVLVTPTLIDAAGNRVAPQ